MAEAARERALTSCPNGPTTDGIDVSIYQGTIDWSAVHTAGMQFAFIRVSDGVQSPDSMFVRNFQHSHAAGMLRGAYQYFRPGDNPLLQANLLLDSIAQAGGAAADDLPAVLDIETTDGVSAQAIARNMTTWLARIEQVTGRRAVVYTAPDVWPILADSPAFGDFPLWVAHYGVPCPRMPLGWTDWRFWQYSSTGHIAGVPAMVDLDHFNGTRDELIGFANGPAKQGDGGAGSDDNGLTPPTGGPAIAQPITGAGCTVGGPVLGTGCPVFVVAALVALRPRRRARGCAG
jgi:lysozyme